MIAGLSTPELLGVFLVAAAAIWFAGPSLSAGTEVLAKRMHLGEALGGMIFLSIVTNLPEIAIVAGAALSHKIGVATGNILGGIAMQTVVLAILDGVAIRGKRPLTYRAASLALVVEGAVVVAVLVVSIMGTQLPDSLYVWRIEPTGLIIALLWIAGLFAVRYARDGLPWQAIETERETLPVADVKQPAMSFARAGIILGAGGVVMLLAGFVLERSSEVLADNFHVSGVLFGSTVLAAATSLPELTTGLASLKFKAYDLAVSDIFGGNAFLPVLFFPAAIISGGAILPHAERTDIFLAALGILLTAIYIVGLLFRPKQRIAGMGLDSILVVVTYALGMGGIFAIAR